MDSDPVAATDQAKEEIRHLGPILGSHFLSLLGEGFQRCEALELCRDLQQEMLGGDDE